MRLSSHSRQQFCLNGCSAATNVFPETNAEVENEKWYRRGLMLLQRGLGRLSRKWLSSSAASAGASVSASNLTKSARKAFGGNDGTLPDFDRWVTDPRSSSARPQEWWHVDGRIKEAIWKLHENDSQRWSISALSDEFSLQPYRIEAILRMKHDEKHNWKPEELHDDMEAAVETAIELYRLESRCSDIQDDQNPDVQALHACYELIYAYISSVKKIEKLQSQLNSDDQDLDKASIAEELSALIKTKQSSFDQLRARLRPSLSEPIYDFEVFDRNRHVKNPPPPVFDVAIQGRLAPAPEQGPGSGKIIVNSDTAKQNRQRDNRFNIIITDISKEKKKQGPVQVVVRQKDGSLRHASRNELERATQNENPVPRDRHIIYTE